MVGSTYPVLIKKKKEEGEKKVKKIYENNFASGLTLSQCVIIMPTYLGSKDNKEESSFNEKMVKQPNTSG